MDVEEATETDSIIEDKTTEVRQETIVDDDTTAAELVQRLESDAEVVAPVGEEEHRTNLLSFVEWATGGEGGAKRGREEVTNGEEKVGAEEEQERCGGGGEVEETGERGEGKECSKGGVGEGEECTEEEEVCEEGEEVEVRVPPWIADPGADLEVVYSKRAIQVRISINVFILIILMMS